MKVFSALLYLFSKSCFEKSKKAQPECLKAIFKWKTEDKDVEGLLNKKGNPDAAAFAELCLRYLFAEGIEKHNLTWTDPTSFYITYITDGKKIMTDYYDSVLILFMTQHLPRLLAGHEDLIATFLKKLRDGFFYHYLDEFWHIVDDGKRAKRLDDYPLGFSHHFKRTDEDVILIHNILRKILPYDLYLTEFRASEILVPIPQ